jgi:hypothetical protein
MGGRVPTPVDCLRLVEGRDERSEEAAADRRRRLGFVTHEHESRDEAKEHGG